MQAPLFKRNLSVPKAMEHVEPVRVHNATFITPLYDPLSPNLLDSINIKAYTTALFSMS